MPGEAVAVADSDAAMRLRPAEAADAKATPGPPNDLSRPLALFIIGLLFRLAFGPMMTIPREPLISILGVIVPVTLCTACVVMGVRRLSGVAFLDCVLLAILCLVATLLAGDCIRGVAVVWVSPYARGAFIGL